MMTEPAPLENSQQLPPRRNILLIVAYDGTAYHGWQRQQPEIDTVQQRVEQSATRVMGHPVTVFGTGRTDAGVHAEGQGVNFFTTNFFIPLPNIRRAINSSLPADIVVKSAREVPDNFHASRSAIGKTYRYTIFTAPQLPAGMANYAYHYPWNPLDIEAMNAAGRKLVGRHDFRGLASSAELRKNTVRTIWRCDCAADNQSVNIYVEGDGFLYNMVRNIAGTLIEIGRGHWQVEQIDKILATCDRRHAGFTAPPNGLYMQSVHYPAPMQGRAISD